MTQRFAASLRRAAELRESKNAAHQRAVRAWVGEPDPVIFTAAIYPSYATTTAAPDPA